MRVVVTGTAGFIGYHLAARLLSDGHEVVGIDGLTPYYDVSLKQARRVRLAGNPGFRDHVVMLEDAESVSAAIDGAAPEVIFHLAAQAGVRHSLKAPRDYIDSNLVGTFHIMEAARRHAVRHLVVASSSSVYGVGEVSPSREDSPTDHPLTLYAATKKACESMTHAYSHLWQIPTTLTRFFTVFGPWGRPDMALAKFVGGILRDEPIEIFNNGQMARDFTYIDDVVESLVRLMPAAPKRGVPAQGVTDSLSPVAPWRVVNIGRGQPVALLDFVRGIEAALQRTATLRFLPIQPGDPPVTFANVDLLEALIAYRPESTFEEGLNAYCEWFAAYYGAGALDL